MSLILILSKRDWSGTQCTSDNLKKQGGGDLKKCRNLRTGPLKQTNKHVPDPTIFCTKLRFLHILKHRLYWSAHSAQAKSSNMKKMR